MNREIKFRIYDKELKESHIEELQDLFEDDYWYDGETEVWAVLKDCNSEQERFVALQYTGLKDKNGVEIYEGDILEYMAIADGKQRDKVIFDRGTFVVDYSEDYKQPVNEINHCAEVIGNIYDNPELIEKEGK